MENRNVIIAVILSTAILIGWSMFVENPNEINKNKFDTQTKTEVQTNIQKPDAPQTTKANYRDWETISRSEALKESDRVLIENSNLSGSISLKGALIDDIVLKNYRETLAAIGCAITIYLAFTVHADEPVRDGIKRGLKVEQVQP